MTENFTKPTIVLAEQDLIDEIENKPLFIEFFTKILDMHPSECLLTDRSSLSDFMGCGMPDTDEVKNLKHQDLVKEWDRWVIAKIHTEFGVTLDRTTHSLVEIYNLIESRQLARVH